VEGLIPGINITDDAVNAQIIGRSTTELLAAVLSGCDLTLPSATRITKKGRELVTLARGSLSLLEVQPDRCPVVATEQAREIRARSALVWIRGRCVEQVVN
jgi:hypothetical protein